MPKITESTVAEHRAMQHRAVLDAAQHLIIAGAGKVPTLAEVASEVGLARSSVYRYASSQHDLMVQLRPCHRDLERAARRSRGKRAPGSGSAYLRLRGCDA